MPLQALRGGPAFRSPISFISILPWSFLFFFTSRQRNLLFFPAAVPVAYEWLLSECYTADCYCPSVIPLITARQKVADAALSASPEPRIGTFIMPAHIYANKSLNIGHRRSILAGPIGSDRFAEP